MKTKCPQGATLIAAIVNVNYVFYASFLLEQWGNRDSQELSNLPKAEQRLGG